MKDGEPKGENGISPELLRMISIWRERDQLRPNPLRQVSHLMKLYYSQSGTNPNNN